MIDRRTFLVSAGAAALAGCTTTDPTVVVQRQVAMRPGATVSRIDVPADVRAMYGPRPNERFPLPAADIAKVPPQYWRREVSNPTGEAPGTIVVDTATFYLYFTQPGGTAMRYGVGLGRQGFGWDGDARIPFKREWPTWTPPSEMIARDPDLEKYREGMSPGLENPLGARALYLYQGKHDTLYRLHGTTEADSIGHAVSSGCVRLLNQDIIDLYDRVPNGTRVVVRPPSAPRLA